MANYRDRAIQYARQIEQAPPRCFLGAYITAAWPTENHVDHCYVVWAALLGVMEDGTRSSADLPVGSAVWLVVRGVLATHKKITGGRLDVNLSRVATARCLAIMIPAIAGGRSFSDVVADHPELQSWEIQRGLISVATSPKEEGG